MLFNSAMADADSGEKATRTQLELRSLARIARLPLVESGWGYANHLYATIKGCNPMLSWGLDSAESKVGGVWGQAQPLVVSVFQRPLTLADSLLCRGLDLLEHQVPIVTLPPELIFVSTSQYVSSNIVRPVLRRADSAKQFGREQVKHVLESRYLHSALDTADSYVDRYLPYQGGYEDDTTTGPEEQTGTIHKVDRFSRKLQRRLTQRTLAEAKALKRQSQDTLQTLLYLAELLAKDPRAVYELSVSAWRHLSEPEPENQAPPTTLEQLTLMLTRETARRLVHLVNYASATFRTLPRNVRLAIHRARAYCHELAHSLANAVNLEDARRETSRYLAKVGAVYAQVNKYADGLLEKDPAARRRPKAEYTSGVREENPGPRTEDQARPGGGKED